MWQDGKRGAIGHAAPVRTLKRSLGLALLTEAPAPVPGSCAPCVITPTRKRAALRGPAWGHPRPRFPGKTRTLGVKVATWTTTTGRGKRRSPLDVIELAGH